MAYVVGTTVELPVTFTITATGVLADPTTVTLRTVAPDGTVTPYTYPSANVIKDATGTYRGLFIPTDDGEWGYEWIGTGAVAVIKDGSLYVAPSVTVAPPALTTTYATVQQLRDEMQIDDEQLTDMEAKRLILQAEDITDSLLGAWPIDTTTGRKIRQTAVLSWQWSKLQRFTTSLAGRLQTDAQFARSMDGGDLWDEYQGPDFSVRGRRSGESLIGSTSMTLLNASGLRRLTSVATPRIGPRSQGLYDYQIANGPDPYEDD